MTLTGLRRALRLMSTVFDRRTTTTTRRQTDADPPARRGWRRTDGLAVGGPGRVERHLSCSSGDSREVKNASQPIVVSAAGNRGPLDFCMGAAMQMPPPLFANHQNIQKR